MDVRIGLGSEPSMYRKFFGTPFRQTLFCVLLSLLISSPAILSGFMNDDYYFLTPLLTYESPFDYYSFASKGDDARLANWWAEDGFGIVFFRPISSLSLSLDFSVFGGNELTAHLHSVLWFVLMLVGALRLLRGLLPPKNAALASVIFAVGAYHTMTLAWVAARHAAVGGAFVMWSAHCYLRFRMESRRRLFAYSIVLFVLALLSSEVALTVPIFAFSYELAFADGPIRNRLEALSPLALITLVYLIYYKLSGYGPNGSDMYLDPFRSPDRYLKELPEKCLWLMGAYLLGIPAIFANFPGAESLPVVAGLLGLAGLLTAVFVAFPLDARRKRLVKWLGSLVFLGMIPAGAGMPDGRGALLSGVAVAALVAILVSRLFQKRNADHKRSKPAVLVAGVLLFGVLALSILIRLALAGMMRVGVAAQAATGRTSFGCERGAIVYVINADFLGTIYDSVVVSAHQGAFFERWYVLSEPAHPLSVTYQGKDTLALDGRGAPLVHDMMFRLFRTARNPLSKGDVIKLPRLEVVVTAVENDRPMAARLEIPDLTDRKKVCLLSFQEGRLRPFLLPAAGETRIIDWGLPAELP